MRFRVVNVTAGKTLRRWCCSHSSGSTLWCVSPALQASILLRRGRLVLVLDLDHTLLASSRFTELDTDTEELLVGDGHGHMGDEHSPASHHLCGPST